MKDYKTKRDRLKNDDNVGVTFSVILAVVVLVVAASLAAIIMNEAGFADAFVMSFA